MLEPRGEKMKILKKGIRFLVLAVTWLTIITVKDMTIEPRQKTHQAKQKKEAKKPSFSIPMYLPGIGFIY